MFCQWIPEEKLKPSAIKEPLCQQKIHRKILDKGLPEDVMPGVKNAKVGCIFAILNTQLNNIYLFLGRITISSIEWNV